MSPDFYFRCQRSGNCCRVGTGRVWFEESELEALAAAAKQAVDAFVAQHVVRVGSRLSLRERADGRCVLLEGQCHCSVYSARPKQCRDFPEWPALQADAQELERAAAYCPGIQRLPKPAAMRALAELRGLLQGESEDLHAAAPVSKAPCLTQEGQRLVSSVEADSFLAQYPGVYQRQEACPALEGEACTAGPARPNICRQQQQRAPIEIEQSISQLAENSGYPWSRAHWPTILADRSAAWQAASRLPELPFHV